MIDDYSALIIVREGDRECYFKPSEEIWDLLVGRNLLDISLEASFVYERVVQLLKFENFIPLSEATKGQSLIYVSDCQKKIVSCWDCKRNIELDPCMYMTFEELERYGGCIGPSMKQVIEWSHFPDTSKFSDEEWESYMIQKEEDRKWKPVYPVDLENPVVLNPIQMERGEILFEKISKFMENQPKDDFQAPMLSISQSWEVSVDFGGWRHDTDFTRSILSVLRKDDDSEYGFYLDKDYLMQCVPHIEKELKEQADLYLEMKDEVGETESYIPSRGERMLEQVSGLSNILVSLLEVAIAKPDYKDWILEIDMPLRDICLVKREARSPSFGGLICHYEIDSFIRKNGLETEIDTVKVSELASKIFNGEGSDFPEA